MSENTQILAAQNPAENSSNAAYSDSNWKSDFGAVSEILYILYLMDCRWEVPYVNQEALTNMKGYCTWITDKLQSLSDPFVGSNPSDAAKLILSVADWFATFDDEMIRAHFDSIMRACADIDPSA